MRKKHIKSIVLGERLKLNLNGDVTREQFDNDTEPVNIVDVVCEKDDTPKTFEGNKVFRTADGNVHRPIEFQYDYKGYFHKREQDLVLWIYN